MQRCLISRKSGTQIKAGATYQQAALLGILKVFLSYISIQSSSVIVSGQVDEASQVSGGGVCFVFCVNQVLRALVRSVLSCRRCCLPLDVRDSMCTSVFEAASTALLCVQGGEEEGGADYRKALGFARGSFWFL